MKINLEKIFELINSKAINLKNELMNNKNWIGNQYENGLWEDFQRMSRLINNELGKLQIII